MMRFSVSLDKEQNEWVEEKADELNGSKTQVIGLLVDRARNTDRSIETQSPITGVHESTVHSRIEQLSERIAELESSIQASQSNIHVDSESDENKPARSFPDKPGDETSRTGAGTEENIPAETGNPSSKAGDKITFQDKADIMDYIDQTVGPKASDQDVIDCWEFLEQRGPASVKSIKNNCHSESESGVRSEDWWMDVKPALDGLPTIEAPESGGDFYRYRYANQY